MKSKYVYYAAGVKFERFEDAEKFATGKDVAIFRDVIAEDGFTFRQVYCKNGTFWSADWTPQGEEKIF